MGTPTWLYYLFALAMLAVAGYAALLLTLSATRGDPSGSDVDIAHLSMGVAMAGMFVPAWAFWPSGFWQLVFAALLVWFVVRSIQSIRRFGLHVPHEAVHAAMSLAMLLMYWYPMSTGGRRSMAMSMAPGGSHGVLDPGIGLVLAVAFCWSAVFTVASPDRGASHHGRHRGPSFAPAAAGEGPGAGGDATLPATTAATRGATAGVAATRGALSSGVLEDTAHAVMCVAMAFMLVLMM